MATNSVLVQFPPDIIAEIDKIAGQGKRTAYLVDLATREIKLHRQKLALREASGAWKTEDHPELAQGASAYIRSLRELDNTRLDSIESNRNAE